MPDVIRIALSERATVALLEVGECFAIVGRGSYPTDPGRMVIYLAPVPLAIATAACQILGGSHRAVRTKPPASGTATPAKPEVPAITPATAGDAAEGHQGAAMPPSRNLLQLSEAHRAASFGLLLQGFSKCRC